MADNENHDAELAELPPLDVDPYRIPTRQCEATLVLADRREEVTIFLSPRSQMHPDGESVDEFLESDRAFVPVRGSEARDQLVNRETILCLEVDTDAPTFLQREESGGGTLEMVRVELEGGAVVEGALRMLGPVQSRRVSDIFNGPQRFLPLEAGSRIIYVNKRRVVRVSF